MYLNDKEEKIIGTFMNVADELEGKLIRTQRDGSIVLIRQVMYVMISNNLGSGKFLPNNLAAKKACVLLYTSLFIQHVL